MEYDDKDENGETKRTQEEKSKRMEMIWKIGKREEDLFSCLIVFLRFFSSVTFIIISMRIPYNDNDNIKHCD